ncbi:cyclase [Micromonospora echinospora]|uniref:SRPBCC family protein n=1 Tax=Micromonospora echinospora TaxID=1877 RepID=UPI000B5AE9EC|nr:SRPBCC family protein [Micromonospora echinospora]OZV79840.1 cyclase [Micromonospora echinospora]
MSVPSNPSLNLRGRLRDQLLRDARDLVGAIGERAVAVVTERITGATGRLSEYAKQGGGPGLVAAATGAQRLAEGKSPVRAMVGAGLAGGKEKLMAAIGARGGKSKGGKKKLKVTNIVETIEVGVPLRVAYNQWTQFADFPSFMKKVENVDQEADEKLTWKAQVLWSHRTWESTVVQQVPDSHIHWRSKGEKGSVDGTVSFHAVAPDLTRILVVLEYHPQGLFERTGNLWRAQGRRVRLELKHFVRHVMTQTVLDPDQVEGWRGEIRDSRVVRDHETALREERERAEAESQEREPEEPEEGEEPEEAPRRQGRPAGRARRPAPRRRPAEEEYEDEYDEYDEEPEDEEPEEEEPPRRRRPERAGRPQPREEERSREERRPREEGRSREEGRPRPAARRTPEGPRRPVVRRRREDRDE